MSTSQPSTNGDNGRRTDGRFAPGNPGGPGNPYARRVAELRAALLGAVTAEDLAEMARALVVKAQAGDVPACKLLLSYLVGHPAAPAPGVDPDRLAEHEAEVVRMRPRSWELPRRPPPEPDPEPLDGDAVTRLMEALKPAGD